MNSNQKEVCDLTNFDTVVATYRMLSREQEVGGPAFLLIALHTAVPFLVILFPVSDLHTFSQSSVPHFSTLL